jgi:hypothetical protein
MPSTTLHVPYVGFVPRTDSLGNNLYIQIEPQFREKDRDSLFFICIKMKLSGLKSDLEPSPAEYEYLSYQKSEQDGQ